MPRRTPSPFRHPSSFRPALSLPALTLIALSLPLAGLARADYAGALRNYEAKKLPEAFAEFKRLAELGDAPSQRLLATLYANGDGTAANAVEALAWAGVAAETDTVAAGLRDKLAGRLDEAGRQKAALRTAELAAQYGSQAVSAKLLPVPAERVADCTIEAEGDATPVKTQAPRFPELASRNNGQANVCFRFYIGDDGVPRRLDFFDVQVSGRPAAALAKAFRDATEQALRGWRFLPANDFELRETPARYCMDYRLDGAGKPKFSDHESVSPEERHRRALEGDAAAQYDMANQISFRIRGKQDAGEREVSAAESLFRASAINGDARGQFRMAKRLLTGDQCEKDVSKGLVWLTMAAQQGHSDAQFVLALRLARGEGVQADPAKALHWLKASSESGHSRGKLHYALHLLISGGATPAEALAQLPAEDSKAYNPDDIGQLEVRALAAAMNGDFASAVRLQETVLAIATELGFSAGQRQRWLDSYRQQQLPGREELRSRLLVAGL